MSIVEYSLFTVVIMAKSSYKKETVSNAPPSLNKRMLDDDVKKKISDAFRNGKDYDDSTFSISSFPFTYGIIRNFVTTGKNDKNKEAFSRSLAAELLNLDFNEKSNDLYKFAQSNELMPKDTDTTGGSPTFRSRKYLNQICSLFREKVLPWMREITQVELNDTIDMFCAQYKNSDVLLCHDDELEDRRIAFIYYLTEEWKEKDGGSLDLFSVNESGDPDCIVRSLTPVFNSLVFFEVSPVSYHQVSEVLSRHKTRLTLSGWFHGTPLPRPERPPSSRAPAITFLPAQQDADLLSQWVTPGYLSIGTQGTIQEQFEGTSEIQLPGFLLNEKYRKLSDSLLHLIDQNVFWTNRGPANKRKYLSMKFDQDFELVEARNAGKDTESEDPKKFKISQKTMEAYNLVNDFIRLFCSEEMFLYLSNVTGLSFHPMAANVDSSEDEESDEESNDSIPTKRSKTEKKEKDTAGVNSKCRYEIRCWSSGCYTLVSDSDSDRGEYALDVNLHCCAEGWQQEFGGYTTYIAQGEDAELLTVLPSSNCLSLAYRDSEALRFVKHVNQKATKSFFDISFIYSE